MTRCRGGKEEIQKGKLLLLWEPDSSKRRETWARLEILYLQENSLTWKEGGGSGERIFSMFRLMKDSNSSEGGKERRIAQEKSIRNLRLKRPSLSSKTKTSQD